MNSKDFEKYLKDIRKETNNFELICPEMFQKSPQLILIFRIILGITQRELERKLGLNGRYISNYESLKYKNLSKGKAELFSKFFEKEFKFGGLNKLSDEELINRFLQVKNSMFVHDNSASFVVNAKPTKQELEVLNVLNNIKTKNMEILLHENLNTNKGKINVDFVIKINNEPKIVIECTQTQSISKKFSYNLNKKIFEIDYRFVKLKTNYPDIRTVLVLAIYEDDLAKYKLQNLVKNNTLAIDDTFINKNLASLPKLILEENGTKTAKT